MSETLPSRRAVSWLMHGIGNLIVVLVVTFGGWYLIADPRVSPFELYPLPFDAALFWALLFVVWPGFNLEFFGFDRLRQPLRGAVITASTAVFAVGVTYAFPVGYGHLNADFMAWIIVAVVVTGLTMENWPWRQATGRGRTALGNKPTNLGLAANLTVRAAVTLTLGILAFIAYYRFAAGTLLHEPVVAGNLYGNALGFMDWFALVTLLYVVGFGSYGLPKPADKTAAEPKAAPRHAAAESTRQQGS
ncbi:hypothetical protein ACFW08_04575 [Streptomyces sp. NPDC058960]|uniref:hypothetical protein n=1 Tax=Streptomyces sp. NPDC058960 TaxID=3346679 RepID=UPI003686C640